MCDTLVAVLPGKILFAKNSDRNPNEGQLLDWYPRQYYARGSKLKCTWIDIPQVERTHAVLLSRPFWMWGAEIGANELGVVIGNEAVFTRQPYAQSGLTGMDILRLALERAGTASCALEEMLRLLRDHGQGGGCALENRSATYHNSFIIADAREAFVLETAGGQTAVEQVRETRTISNGLTIPGFAEKHSDTSKTRLSRSQFRQRRTCGLMPAARGVGDLMRILRDHGTSSAPDYSMFTGALSAPCVHAGGLLKSVQTTASWAAELTLDGACHWVTATAVPCLSVFKPVRVDEPLDVGPVPTGIFDSTSLFWRHERFERLVMRDYAHFARAFQRERDLIETGWLTTPPSSMAAFEQADQLLARWTATIEAEHPVDRRPFFTRRYWKKRDGWARLATM